MNSTTNVKEGYQLSSNARLFNGGLSDAFNNVVGGVTNFASSTMNSFMGGLTNIVSASANVVGSISPEVASAVTAGIGASSGVPGLGGGGPKLWDNNTTSNVDTKSSQTMIFVGVGALVLVGLIMYFKKK
jgi:hypothetical protein